MEVPGFDELRERNWVRLPIGNEEWDPTFLSRFREDFIHGSAELSRMMGAVNTIFLLTSSLTMALSIAAIQRADKAKSLLMLGLTIGFALAFFVVKYFEWSAKFEHGLHRGLEEKVCIMLGHPKTCPHGKAIPPGECCRRLEKEPGQIISTVADLAAGEEAVVAYLHSEDASDLRKLMAIGGLPGTAITLKQRFPSYLVQIGNSQFGIDEHMARQIYVRSPGRGRRRRRRRGRG